MVLPIDDLTSLFGPSNKSNGKKGEAPSGSEEESESVDERETEGLEDGKHRKYSKESLNGRLKNKKKKKIEAIVARLRDKEQDEKRKEDKEDSDKDSDELDEKEALASYDTNIQDRKVEYLVKFLHSLEGGE